MNGEQRSSPCQLALEGPEGREHLFRREVVQDLRGDDQVERTVWHLLGERTPLDPDVPAAREAFACRVHGPLGDVYREQLVAAVCEHLSEDPDRGPSLKGPVKPAFAEHLEGSPVLVALVLARLEAPGVA